MGFGWSWCPGIIVGAIADAWLIHCRGHWARRLTKLRDIQEQRNGSTEYISCFFCFQGDRGFDGQLGPKGDQGEKGERVS